jgi:CheY-like chemotaxis protein
MQKPILQKELHAMLREHLEVDEAPSSVAEGERHIRILAADDDEVVGLLYQKIWSDQYQDALNQLDPSGLSAEQTEADEKRVELTFAAQEEAVELGRMRLEQGEPCQMAFLDMRMPPGIDGLETAKALRELDPRIYIVFVSAFSDVTPQQVEQELGERVLYLNKPFTDNELTQLAKLLAHSWHQDRIIEEVSGTQRPGRSVESLECDVLVDEQMMQLFINSMEEKREQLHEALQQKNWSEIRGIAHNIKGTGTSFGYPGLTENAKGVQLSIDQDEEEVRVVELTEALLAEIERSLSGSD